MHMEVLLVCLPGGAYIFPAPVLGGITESVAERWVLEALWAAPSTPKGKQGHEGRGRKKEEEEKKGEKEKEKEKGKEKA